MRAWREAFAQLCQIERVPPLKWVTVEVAHLCKDRRLPDIGAAFPAVKAGIDGIVDAGVIPDDNAEFLHALTFTPPFAVGYDALVLRVTGPVCSMQEQMERKSAERDRLVKALK